MVLSNAERQARYRARLKALAEGLVEVVIIVREPGRLKPDFSLSFALPTVPRVGDYISIYRPDSKLHTEDVVVRRIWWHLQHDQTESYADGDDEQLVGRSREIMVECDPAIGPSARDQWRDHLEMRADRGAKIERFEVERLSLRESELYALGSDRDKDE